MTSTNQYGVSNLKNALSIIAGIVRGAFNVDINEDGEISTAEKIQYSMTLIPQVLPMVGLLPGIKNEIKRGELTSQEIDEVVDFAVTLDFLPDDRDEAEQYVRDIILWVNYNRRFVAKTIKRFAKAEAEELEKDIVIS